MIEVCNTMSEQLSLSLSLTTTVTVNVGRAGAASLDVIQEVEYVKQEAKVVYLLECLQKTPPPVSHWYSNTSVVKHLTSVPSLSIVLFR